MEKYRIRIIIVIILLQALFNILINQFFYTYENFTYAQQYLPYINVVTLVLTGFVLFSIRLIGEEIRKKIEFNLLKSHLQQIQSLVDMLQTQRHEYGKYIYAIQTMIYLGEIEEAKKYIDGISENFCHAQDIVYTDNPALTALINSKMKVAEIKSIKFDFAIKCDLGGLNISSWDLTSILGNILDNAFEATLQEEDNRNVGLEIRFEDNKYVIYVYNTGTKIQEKEINKIFQLGYSTKNKKTRGYGLYIVKNLVEQYGGEITVSSNVRTVFIVKLPSKKGAQNAQKNIS